VEELAERSDDRRRASVPVQSGFYSINCRWSHSWVEGVGIHPYRTAGEIKILCQDRWVGFRDLVFGAVKACPMARKRGGYWSLGGTVASCTQTAHIRHSVKRLVWWIQPTGWPDKYSRNPYKSLYALLNTGLMYDKLPGLSQNYEKGLYQ
jgi:hypothetical protein